MARNARHKRTTTRSKKQQIQSAQHPSKHGMQETYVYFALDFSVHAFPKFLHQRVVRALRRIETANASLSDL
jgi:hypothetical protein